MRNKSYKILFTIGVLFTQMISFAQDSELVNEEAVSNNGDQLIYAIPFLIILVLLYVLKSARRKMITIGAGELKIMTLILLLSGTSKEKNENWKHFTNHHKGSGISGGF